MVILEAKTGKENDLKAALSAVIEPSIRDETCLEYRLHQDLENPCQFIFYENWTSKEDHKQHSAKGYINDLKETLSSLLVRPFQVISAQEL